MDWLVEEWSKVIFTDEFNFKLFPSLKGEPTGYSVSRPLWNVVGDQSFYGFASTRLEWG